MEKRLRVVVCGRSLVLGGLAASFQRLPQLEVISFIPSLDKAAAQELAVLVPDVILFDTDAGLPEATFSLLQTCPALCVVGLDPAENRATLWAGQSLSELSVNGLVQMLLAR